MNAKPPVERNAVMEVLVQTRISIVATIATAILCCGVYPVIVWGLGQAIFPRQANGSLLKDASGNIIGSRLIGQAFTLPKYFHPRPSAAGSGYDPTSTGGTNLGPTSDKLINGVHGQTNPANNFDGVADLVKAYRTENSLAADAPVPADAVTRSASGCDPHISVANALLQAPRVAKARNLTVDQVKALIDQNTDGPDLGFLGEKGVNVLSLNLALDESK
jgi:K+-transporting ATPase ATPase C chain